MFACETEVLATEAKTKAFSVETEAKTKTFGLEAEARPRHLKFQPRRDRAEALLRLETASRPRRQDQGHVPALQWGLVLSQLHCNFSLMLTRACLTGQHFSAPYWFFEVSKGTLRENLWRLLEQDFSSFHLTSYQRQMTEGDIKTKNILLFAIFVSIVKSTPSDDVLMVWL